MSRDNCTPFRILVTGTGYCGTGWAALLLTQAGMTCGHEKVFKHTGNVVEANAIYPAESSWPAAFHLGHPLLKGTKIIHLMRHPLRVIESWSIARPDHSYRRIGADTKEKVTYECLAGRYLHIVGLLNGIPAVRIEDGPKPLLTHAGLAVPDVIPPPGINTHRYQGRGSRRSCRKAQTPWLRWETFPDMPRCRELRKWAENNGYGKNQ